MARLEILLVSPLCDWDLSRALLEVTFSTFFPSVALSSLQVLDAFQGLHFLSIIDFLHHFLVLHSPTLLHPHHLLLPAWLLSLFELKIVLLVSPVAKAHRLKKLRFFSFKCMIE